jgi:hypothetical protein
MFYLSTSFEEALQHFSVLVCTIIRCKFIYIKYDIDFFRSCTQLDSSYTQLDPLTLSFITLNKLIGFLLRNVLEKVPGTSTAHVLELPEKCGKEKNILPEVASLLSNHCHGLVLVTGSP